MDNNLLKQLAGGLIISCYAATDYNVEFDDPRVILALVRAVANGGARGIRINLKHIPAVLTGVDIPVIGIEKKYKEDGEMRITPTLCEVSQLAATGVKMIAIDATRRARWDRNSLSEFVQIIKDKYELQVVGDISTYEEGVAAVAAGVDAVGTTLSGYTPYSSNLGKLGSIPPKPPDYELIERLSKRVAVPVIAEGRISTPVQAKEALQRGAYAVVVGTAISNPEIITRHFVYYMEQN
jgi:N-acylglucosamine-6-phosphate 2-epimerase